MANIDATGLVRDVRHQGTFGNKSVAYEKIAAKQPALADVLRYMKLPRGTLITDVREIHGAAGGAATTISYGVQPTDGSAGDNSALLAAVACTAAGTNRMTKSPYTLTKESYVVGVIGGNAAAATVDWEVIVDYVYPGLS